MTRMEEPIILDGSHGEGGGSLVRVALALSCITGKPFIVEKIRANRQEPGLKAQHLCAINALKEICSAQTNEIALSSETLEVNPGKIKSGKYQFDIGTAGSIALFLQAVLLPCLFAPRKITLTIKGGTCGEWQAPVEYLQNILLPQLQRFAEKLEIKLLKRGYYPKGEGVVIVEVTPKFNLKRISVEEIAKRIRSYQLIKRGNLISIRGISHASFSLEPAKVAERQAEAVKSFLKKYAVPIIIQPVYQETASDGSGITLWAEFAEGKESDDVHPFFVGADALGKRGKRAEEVGKEAAEELIHLIDAGRGVDRHFAGQLIPFMALLPGSEIESAEEITSHTFTNIKIAEKFLPVKFRVEGKKITSVSQPP